MSRRCRTRHGVVVVVVAQPRRFYSHSSKHAVDRPDAPQQVTYVPAPYHDCIAAVVDALVSNETLATQLSLLHLGTNKLSRAAALQLAEFVSLSRALRGLGISRTQLLPEGFEPNDFFEIGREVCGELVENMSLVDEFTNPKKGKTSHCYRITYRSMDRSLTDDEVNAMQETLREKAESQLGVELR